MVVAGWGGRCSAPMGLEPDSPYDKRAYQRLTSVVFADGKLQVVFENGDAGTIDASVLERPLGRADWTTLTWNEYELSVMVEGLGRLSIPWIDVRRAQDPAFAAYLEELEQQEARLAGARLRFFREQQGLSIAGLAELSGLPAERIDLSERGGDLSLVELRTLLEVLQVSLIDFVSVGAEA